MKKNLIFWCLLGLCACSSKPDPYLLPTDATQLLAGQDAKTWKIARRFNGKYRMNMGDCFLSYRQTFSRSGRVQDNNEQYPNCGESLKADWEFAKNEEAQAYLKLSSPQLPYLMRTEKPYKFFKILHLSEEELILQYQHQQYAERRLITDIYVPEAVNIEDRAFHL